MAQGHTARGRAEHKPAFLPSLQAQGLCVLHLPSAWLTLMRSIPASMRSCSTSFRAWAMLLVADIVCHQLWATDVQEAAGGSRGCEWALKAPGWQVQDREVGCPLQETPAARMPESPGPGPTVGAGGPAEPTVSHSPLLWPTGVKCLLFATI